MRRYFKNLMGYGMIGFFAVSLLAGLEPGTQLAQASETTFPTKPVVAFNSSPAGSPADVMARQVAQYAKKFLGQPMVIVTKPGGSGGVMFAALLAEPADGYTLSTATAALVTSLQGELKKQFSFNDLDFIANVQREPFVMAVRSDSPFKTLGDMIEYAKKNPRLKIGGQGTGSSQHLMVLALAEEADIKISWLPFGGGAETIPNLLGGHVPVAVTAPASVNPYVESGKIRSLALSGDQRIPHWKEVPTFKELGFNVIFTQYRGFAAKKGLPPAVKAKLVGAIKNAVAEPGFKEYMAKNNLADAYMGPEEFSAMARADFELMGKLMQKVEHKK
jgi:tripartite-type tricarboxylate transporter receptor subunit TctC